MEGKSDRQGEIASTALSKEDTKFFSQDNYGQVGAEEEEKAGKQRKFLNLYATLATHQPTSAFFVSLQTTL